MFVYQAYAGTSLLATAFNTYLWFDCNSGRWTRSIVPTGSSDCPDIFSCVGPYPTGTSVGSSWDACPYTDGPRCTVPQHSHTPHSHTPHSHTPHSHTPHSHAVDTSPASSLTSISCTTPPSSSGFPTVCNPDDYTTSLGTYRLSSVAYNCCCSGTNRGKVCSECPTEFCVASASSSSSPSSSSSSVGLIAGVGGGVVAVLGIGAAVYLMKMRAKKVQQSPQTAVPVAQAVELAPVEATQVTQLHDQSLGA